MCVDDIIARIPQLDPSDRRRLREALAAAEHSGTVDEQARERGLQALQRLMDGLVEGRRTDLSQNIDEALYGGDG